MPALIYAAMDWLEGRQGAVEAELGRLHLASQASPARMASFVSWTSDPRRDRRAAPAGTARKDENPAGPSASEPERLHSERFARGEIDEDEYRQRLTSLRAASLAAVR